MDSEILIRFLESIPKILICVPCFEAGEIAFTDAACPRLRRGRYPSWTGALSVVDGGAIRLARMRYPSGTLQLYVLDGGFDG